MVMHEKLKATCVRLAHVSSIDAFNNSEAVLRFKSVTRLLYKNMAADGQYLCLGSDHSYASWALALNSPGELRRISENFLNLSGTNIREMRFLRTRGR
jgi:hypothetical protein